MLTRLSRILMNEADSSPGNGAPVAAAAPTAPTDAPTAPSLDVDAFMSRLTGVIDEKLAAHKNATFAELRKSGAFKQDKPTEPTVQPTTSASIATQAGLTGADLDARFELERVIASREGKHGLNEAQSRRLRSALSGVSRESFATEADSYLADMGLVKASTPVTPTIPTPAPAPAAKPNISDRGAASPTDTRDSDGVLNSRPLEMTGHDVDSLILKHGHAKGMQMFQERVLAALGGVRIKPPRG